MMREAIIFLLVGILAISGCHFGNNLATSAILDGSDEIKGQITEEVYDPCQITNLYWDMENKEIIGGSTKIKVIGQCPGLKIEILNIDTDKKIVSSEFSFSDCYIYYPQIYEKGRYVLRALYKGEVEFENKDSLWIKGDCQLKSKNLVVKGEEYFKYDDGYWVKNNDFVQFYAPTNGLCEGWKAKLTLENKNNGVQYNPKENYLNENYVTVNETARTACLKNSNNCYSKYLVTVEIAPGDKATTFLYVTPTICRIENFTAERPDTQNSFMVDMQFDAQDCENADLTLEFYPLTSKTEYVKNPYEKVIFTPTGNSFAIEARCLLDYWGKCAYKSQYRVTPRMNGEPVGEPFILTVREN